jgi:hypothetical protein
MGFLDRLLGRDEQPDDRSRPDASRAPARSDDEIAVERYRYLLRTAPPETIEQVHAEAFEKLTPEQRQMVFDDLSANAPQGEAPRDASASSLASAATRSELRNPGTLERSFGGGQRGPGFGSMVGSSLLGTVAGFVIGSAIVSAFLPPMDDGSSEAGADGSGDAGSDGGGSDGGGSDGGSDAGGSDAGGWDASGGDFGGGDFGGGDFGGGDFGF